MNKNVVSKKEVRKGETRRSWQEEHHQGSQRSSGGAWYAPTRMDHGLLQKGELGKRCECPSNLISEVTAKLHLLGAVFSVP